MANRVNTAESGALSSPRRGLLALSLGALPVVAAAAPHPDAELIRLCAEFSALELQNRALWDVADISDRERDVLIAPISAAQRLLLNEIYEIEASTLAGLLARLEMIHLYNPPQLESPCGWDDEMVGALLHDALAVLKGGAA